MNELTARGKIARITTTREGLTAVREDIMKAEALGKSISIKPYIETYRISTMFVTFLIKAGAVEDIKPEAPKTEGKYLRWIYTRSGENGPVDSWLVDKVLALQKEHDRAYREHKKGQREELAPVVVEKKPLNNAVIEWLQKQIDIDDNINNMYLRIDQRGMYQRIITIFTGLKELKEAMKKVSI